MKVKNKAVFWDRDGVINRERGTYTHAVKDFELLPDVVEMCKEWADSGYQLIVITNQGGIAKGLYSLEDFWQLMEVFEAALRNAGVELTDTFISPHHQDYGLSLDRKPDSLLLERAMAQYDIDEKQSYFIGDSERDLAAAHKAGVTGILIEPNSSLTSIREMIP